MVTRSRAERRAMSGVVTITAAAPSERRTIEQAQRLGDRRLQRLGLGDRRLEVRPGFWRHWRGS